jgi:hypothetical protein
LLVSPPPVQTGFTTYSASGDAYVVPPLPDRFPHRHGGTVVIRMNNGDEFRSTCTSPRGSGPRGVEWNDIDDKYRALAPLAGLAPRRVDESLAIIRAFEAPDSVTRLLALIGAG